MRKVCCAKYPQRLNSVIKGLLAVSLLGLSGHSVKAEEFTPTPTLGENSIDRNPVVLRRQYNSV